MLGQQQADLHGSPMMTDSALLMSFLHLAAGTPRP
jgi:hypothetical protein